VRLARYLSIAGVASRRKAEELITAGKVKVNGSVHRDLGKQIDPESDVVEYGGRKLAAETKVYYKVHKPVGYECTVGGTYAKKRVTDLVPETPRVVPVGRLDKDSSGLMILTNDGDLAYELTHPKFEHTKLYEVTVQEKMSPSSAKKLCSGVHLEDGTTVRADAATLINPHMLHITLHEGKNRQIRRMLAVLHLTVTSLVRIQEGRITLDDLPPGGYAQLTRSDIL
jgi:23S rRNA pseudouridine2605 synthase